MKTPSAEDISLAYKVIEAVAEGMSLGSALTAHQLGRYKFSKICALYPEKVRAAARKRPTPHQAPPIQSPKGSNNGVSTGSTDIRTEGKVSA